MRVRSLILPGLVFFVGAVFGRLFGVRPLVRGAVTVASMSGVMSSTSGSRGEPRRVAHRPVRRRPAQRRRSAKAA